MSTLRQHWTDKRLEEVISLLLRIGVSSSAAVVLFGGILYLAQYGAGHPNNQHFQGEPAQLHTLQGILAAMLSFDSRAIIQFGLLLLILTPIARVAFSAVAFMLQGDRFYVMVTLIVLAVLLVNLLWG